MTLYTAEVTQHQMRWEDDNVWWTESDQEAVYFKW